MSPYENIPMEILEILAWPFVAVVLGIFVSLIFRAQIAQFINRIKNVGAKGITTELPPPESQQEQRESNAEAVQHLLDVVGTSVVIAEQEQRILSELEEKGLDANSDSARVLIKHLAGTQLLLAFERAYSSIFGSQIFLLKKLNEVTGPGRDLGFVTAHVENIKALFPELADWTFEQYLSFLYTHLLVIREGDRFHITHFGVEFLTWMMRNGRSESKLL
jgi:hypothetical protein